MDKRPSRLNRGCAWPRQRKRLSRWQTATSDTGRCFPDRSDRATRMDGPGSPNAGHPRPPASRQQAAGVASTLQNLSAPTESGIPFYMQWHVKSATKSPGTPALEISPCQPDTKFPGADFCDLTRTLRVADSIAQPDARSGRFPTRPHVRHQYAFLGRTEWGSF